MAVPPELLLRAAGLLRAGRLVAFPTETVYGLGANALDPAAVRRIYEAKGRPSTSPLIVHVSSIAMARSLAVSWPPLAESLATRFWPGPLTLVVPKSPAIPDNVTAGLPTVGLRMPDHPLAAALIEAAGVPLAAPSANPFTGLSPTTADHVRQSLGDRVDLILDGGPCRVGIESTVVSLAGPQPVLLRPGMVSRAAIEALAGPLADPHSIAGSGSHPAPGMHPRHYSPRTPLHIAPLRPTPSGRGYTLRRADMPADPAGYAAALYDTLHRVDSEGWDWIAIEPPPDTPEWSAVLDRIRRAAHP
jgi:L-threonylcarbamoyladenylate synthase